ncbi:MAG: hypothetical protein M1832_000335 [Thelocarpon impressellum]|nr:MAG: hypothetical protein M1832_000335 [Thelocarpon impressellum]
MAESILPRNVFLRDAAGVLLGGLWQQGAFTNADFINMAAIFVVVPAYPPHGIFPRREQDQVGDMLEANDIPLELGDYVVLFRDQTPVDVEISNEPLARRVYSVNTSGRTPHFTAQVRSRDRKCVVTGQSAVFAGLIDYGPFDAAHIFPLALESLWVQHGYGRYISDGSSQADKNDSKIKSTQNGMLLRRDIHGLFDAYKVAINPDAVLSKMRGAGELAWEHDFPPGSDVMGEILAGPKAAERVELELADRLRAVN